MLRRPPRQIPPLPASSWLPSLGHETQHVQTKPKYFGGQPASTLRFVYDALEILYGSATLPDSRPISIDFRRNPANTMEYHGIQYLVIKLWERVLLISQNIEDVMWCWISNSCFKTKHDKINRGDETRIASKMLLQKTGEKLERSRPSIDFHWGLLRFLASRRPFFV